MKAAAETGERVRVLVGDTPYDLEVMPASRTRDVREDYDPEAAREAWMGVAGILPDIDAEAWIRRIKEEREH